MIAASTVIVMVTPSLALCRAHFVSRFHAKLGVSIGELTCHHSKSSGCAASP
jgi:hypothetical protein